MPLSQNCDHETSPGQYCNQPANWLALSTRPTDPWAAHDSESASVRAFCSHEHAKSEHRPKLAAAQRTYEDMAALRNDKPVLDAWRWALAAYPEPIEMCIVAPRRRADAMDCLAAAVSGLPSKTLSDLLYGEVFSPIVPDSFSAGDVYGGPASALAHVFTRLPDDARTEAIAEFIAELFKTAPGDVFRGIVGNVVKRLPEDALSAEDAGLVTAQLLTEA